MNYFNYFNLLNHFSLFKDNALPDDDSDDSVHDTNSNSNSNSSEEEDTEIELDNDDNDSMYLGSAFESDDEDDSTEIVNGKYYLGSYKNMDDDMILIGTRIGINWFYNNELYHINDYLYWYSGFELDINDLQILQCFKKTYCLITNKYLDEPVDDDRGGIASFNICILKTHWIRLIQRKWKSVFRQRRILLTLININIFSVLTYREHQGPITKIPELKGMLYDLVLQKHGLYHNRKYILD